MDRTPKIVHNNTNDIVNDCSTSDSPADTSTSTTVPTGHNIELKLARWRKRISSSSAAELKTEEFDFYSPLPRARLSAPASISTSIISQSKDDHHDPPDSGATNMTHDDLTLTQITDISESTIQDFETTSKTSVKDLPTTDQSTMNSTYSDDLTSLKQIVAWLCDRIEPLIPLQDTINEINTNLKNINNFIPKYEQRLSSIEEQLQSMKQNTPDFTQQHYDAIQREYEEDTITPQQPTAFPFESDIRKKIHELDERVIECEQYSRRENLVLSGIPDSVSQTNLQSKVLEILAAAGFRELRPDDISACHRLAKPRNSRYPARVIVRFLSRKPVDFCISNRERVQNDIKTNLNLNIRIFENLCKANEEALRICKWLQENGAIHDHFIRNGFVKIVKTAGGRPVKVRHPEFLRDKFDNVPDFSNR
jgi:hypothetical protein